MRKKSKKQIPPIPPTEVVECKPEINAADVSVEKALTKEANRNAKMYFNGNTCKAICDYQLAQEKREREKLYVSEILPAFEKLVENLINIHKFTSLHDTYDDLKNDCVNFLFETIKKFDPSRGTNAFSYFNVVAKNWLIIKTKQKAQRVRRTVSLDDPESLSISEQHIIEEHNTVQSQDIILENFTAADNIISLLYDIRTKARTENELACINSIITIFENVDEIDLINKSAIMLYIRELSGLSPKQLTTTLQMIKKHYRRMKIDPKFKLF